MSSVLERYNKRHGIESDEPEKKLSTVERFRESHPDYKNQIGRYQQKDFDATSRARERALERLKAQNTETPSALERISTQYSLPETPYQTRTASAPHPSTKNNRYLQEHNVTPSAYRASSEKVSPITIGAEDRLSMAINGKPSAKKD